MRYLACILGGFILGSSVLWAQPNWQSEFLDYGAIRSEEQGAMLQWQLQQLQNEIRKGHNPYTQRPCR